MKLIHHRPGIFALVAAATVSFALPANAGSIGVNTGPLGEEIDGQVAGAEVTQSVWNDKMAGNFGATAVKDDSGTLLTTTVAVNTQWTNTSGSGNTDGDHTLMNGGMDNGGGPQGYTVTDVPYASYDVYIYYDGGSDVGRGGAYQVWDSDNGDAVLATQDGYDTFVFAGTYVEASTVGTGGSGIDDNGTPGDPSDDFAVGSNYVKFTGLSAPNIKIRSVANLLGNPATPRAAINGFQIVEAGPDIVAPTPDPMTFASVPAATGDSQITMTASTASDPSGVEYYFAETSGNPGGADSGWQDSPTYTDTGLTPSTTYSYTVKARDKSAGQNETAASAAESATTDAPDNTAPTPNPMTFASVPAADSDTEISMTASTASDPAGVEYYFAETSGNPGGADSGWQDSPTYTNSGLDPSTTYSYTVKARDKSANQNETAASAAESATTNSAPTTGMVIGVNTGPVGQEIGAATSAGVVPQTNWNDKMAGNFGATAVTDDGGTLLATTVSVNTQWTNTSGSGTSDGDHILMNGGMDNGGGPQGFTVTDVPFADYDVYIYYDGGSDVGRGGAYQVWDSDNGDAVLATQDGYDTFTFAGTYVEASTVGTGGSGIDDNGTPGDPSDDFAVGSNYVKFTGLSAPNIKIRSIANTLGNPSVPRAAINGFQIVEAAPDIVAPTPDPMTFASVPAAASDSQITMTATTATDPTGVEYYFAETSGNPGGADSGWQDSTTYTDTGLTPATTYSYTVKARDKSSNQNETAASAAESATTDAADSTAPTPDPMTFASVPAATSETEIAMTASTATDPNGVEYYFAETSGNPGGADSGWQDSTTYTDTGLDPGTTYTYTVTARDKSGGQNETAASAAESATTDSDTEAPMPDPMTFASVPFALSDSEISMTATTATDNLSGVEYYFAETSGNPGGDDSGWQDSPTYTDSGLDPSTTYSYTVKARDKSAGQNETAASSAESATTTAPPTVGTIIGVNTGPVGQEIGAATSAGVVPQTNWNDKMAGNFGATAVKDDGGTLLATTVSVNTQWTNTSGSGNSDGDHTLMNGGMDNGGGPQGYTVTGVPYATYDVYIYYDGGSDAGRGGAYQVWDSDNGDAVLATQDGYDTFTFAGTYVEASTVGTGGSGIDDNGTPGDPSDDFAVGSNYVKFTGLTAPNIKIRSVANLLGNPATPRAAINGFQIVESSAGGGDYDVWAAMFPSADLSDPDGDLDGDGVTNNEERLFGTDPTDASSLHQYPTGLFDSTEFSFSFTRRDDALTGLFSDIETSFDLQMWTEDIGAMQVEGTVDGSTNVEIVEVTLSPGLLTAPKLFVRVNQNEGVLISENFEVDNGGFTVVTTAGTDWEHGDPDSSSLGGAVTEGNGGSTNAWGTNLGDISGTTADPGYFADTTMTALRSTVIDLTGIAAAELLFAEAIDIQPGDTAEVFIIDDITDTVIAGPAPIHTSTDGDINAASWANVGPIAIPGAALGQAVRIEWRFTGNNGTTNMYMGWYIDDVTVRRAMP